MGGALRNIIMAIVVFAVGVAIITSQITGTDAGSKLIQGIGYLLLGVVVILVLVKAATSGGN